MPQRASDMDFGIVNVLEWWSMFRSIGWKIPALKVVVRRTKLGWGKRGVAMINGWSKLKAASKRVSSIKTWNVVSCRSSFCGSGWVKRVSVCVLAG